MGMVALIQVGSPDANLDAATGEIGRMRGLAKSRFEDLVAQVE